MTLRSAPNRDSTSRQAEAIDRPDAPVRFAQAYAYDALDRLVGISAPGGEEETFTLDALGRKWTRSLDGDLTDTYTYLGASYSIVRIERPSLTVDSAIDAIGTRLATGTSDDDFGFALPDLHGNFAAALADDAATISDAFRYDGYGQLLAEATSALPTPWRFQGKPLLSEAGDDLYDFESRAYDPRTGTFTQLDTFAGSIQNPLTLNRFLYAHANPTTLIDPDGHAYSRAPLAELGASAYFATDFFEGAAHLVGALLDTPALPYGELFASEPRFSPDGLMRLPHPEVSGAETWLHRSAYFEGKTDYWYAFAGNPGDPFSGEPSADDPLPELDAAESVSVGFGQQVTLYPARQVELEPGSLTGSTYLADGTPVASLSVEVAVGEEVLLQAVAIINGTEHALVGDGPLAGTWIATEHVVEAP